MFTSTGLTKPRPGILAMKDYVQALVTVLSLINPVICATIFMKSQGQLPRKEQIKAAIQAMLSVCVVLALSAVLGTQILGMFGISLSAFSFAGGLILAWMGFSMLGRKPSKPDSHDHHAAPPSASLTPLILFAASPGTITGVITLSVAHSALGTTTDSIGGGCRRLRGNPVDLAAVNSNGLRFSERRQPAARHGVAFHGADRTGDGYPVCTVRTEILF